MAVINQYKFYGKYIDTAAAFTMFDDAGTLPLISETYIIKSFRVTNKSAAKTNETHAIRPDTGKVIPRKGKPHKWQ